MNGLFQDAINFTSKMTPRRATNAASVLTSYYRSKLTHKARLSGMPISVAFEPTTSCNLRCPECPSGLRSFTRPTGMLSEDLFRDTIDQLAPDLTYLTFYFQGEPYLHPKFLEMVRYALSRGIYTATSTNAHYLSDDQARATVESGLDRLIFSVDGMTQETYEAYRRGGRLQKVREGIDRIMYWKRNLRSKTPHTIIQFLVVGPNEHEIPQVIQLKEETGVDRVTLKTAQIYDYTHGSPLIPKADKYSRYRRKPDGTFEIKNRLLNHCWKMWHSCVITWDGKIVPCCFDKDAHHVLGDLSRRSFSSIWEGPDYVEFRNALLQSRSKIDMCRNCTEGTM